MDSFSYARSLSLVSIFIVVTGEGKMQSWNQMCIGDGSGERILGVEIAMLFGRCKTFGLVLQ